MSLTECADTLPIWFDNIEEIPNDCKNRFINESVIFTNYIFELNTSKQQYCFIDISSLSNKMISETSIIVNDYNDYIIIFYDSKNQTDDIIYNSNFQNFNNKQIDMKILMEKLEGFKYLIVEASCKGVEITPGISTLIAFVDQGFESVINLSSSQNLKYFIKDNLNCFNPIYPTLPDTIKVVVFNYCKEYIDMLPESVEELHYLDGDLSRSITMWPKNLKRLYLQFDDGSSYNCSYQIGMFPPSLEELSLHTYEYDYYLDLPPCLKKLDLKINKIYKHEINIPKYCKSVNISFGNI
jgi:hypothetical protein